MRVEAKGESEVVKMAVDSGTTETVMGEDMLQSAEKKMGAAAKRGVEYEVANGVTIPNLGEKTTVFPALTTLQTLNRPLFTLVI